MAGTSLTTLSMFFPLKRCFMTDKITLKPLWRTVILAKLQTAGPSLYQSYTSQCNCGKVFLLRSSRQVKKNEKQLEKG